MSILKNTKHILIAVAAGLLIKLLLPAENGLTAEGVNVLALFFPTLYLWITAGTGWVSLIALALLPLTKILPADQIYGSSLGSPMVVAVIACLLLTAALGDTGVTSKISIWLVTRKFVRGKPYAFLSMFVFSYLILGFFMTTFSVTVLYIAFAEDICTKLGYKKGDKFYTSLMLSIVWGVAASCAATPIGHTIPLVIIGFIGSRFGITVSFAQWMMVGIPYAFVMGAVSILIIRFIVRPDTSKLAEYNLEELKKDSKPMGGDAKITLAVFLVIVVLWMLPEFAGSVAPRLVEILNLGGMSLAPILGITFLCILSMAKRPVINFKKLISAVSIELIIFLAAVLAIGSAVSSQSSGISAFLQNILTPVTAGIPPLALLIFLATGALIMTNFTINMVTVLLFMNLAITMLIDTDISVLSVIMLICFMSNVAVLTPSASPFNPLIFGQGHLDIKASAKYNLVYIAASLLIGMLLILPVSNLIF